MCVCVGGDRPYNFSSPLSETVALQKTMTEVLVPTLEALSEEPAVYLNEVCLSPSSYFYPSIIISHHYKTCPLIFTAIGGSLPTKLAKRILWR